MSGRQRGAPSGHHAADPLILPDQILDRLWHISFNQLTETNEKLVSVTQDMFFGAEFSASAGNEQIVGLRPSSTTWTASPPVPEALPGSVERLGTR